MDNITVGEFTKWLDQFEDDTIIEFEGAVYDLPRTVNLEGDYKQHDFMYSPAREPWHYKPTDEAAARGSKEAFHPYKPGEIVLGDGDRS